MSISQLLQFTGVKSKPCLALQVMAAGPPMEVLSVRGPLQAALVMDGVQCPSCRSPQLALAPDAPYRSRSRSQLRRPPRNAAWAPPLSEAVDVLVQFPRATPSGVRSLQMRPQRMRVERPAPSPKRAQLRQKSRPTSSRTRAHLRAGVPWIGWRSSTRQR